MIEKTVLAIDPGTKKCGMALVQRISTTKVELLWQAVAPTEGVVPKLHEAYAREPYQLIIVGDGTHSKEVVASIRENLPAMGILKVDEKDTTFQARERYWEHNPRRGWRRLLPSTLQVPPEPVDAYVAMILAERVLLAA